ncbi:hypothetical protein MTR67_007077 [Solanum verrucosum]|uniref:Uncharacterized protein n=1 Tax=Solanum verrucosum TaxID=315347 RepID=A0AAF0PZ60_SOLVR|nr:hypothetical protein MTR67_007077 [Solanum verrucosum]
MVHAQQIEEEKLKGISREKKRSRSDDGNSSHDRSDGHGRSRFRQRFSKQGSSNPPRFNNEDKATEEAQHLKKLIQDYIASFIKVGDKNDFHQYVVENLDSSVQLTPELSTQIWKEKVVGGTHKGRCYGLGSRNDVRRLQSGLEGIGSSRQAEALDGVQIAAMLDQIAKLTVALAELNRRRVAEQERMSEIVQQIKE